MYSPKLSFILSSISWGIPRAPSGFWVRILETVLIFQIVALGSEGWGCVTSTYHHYSRMPLAMFIMENSMVPVCVRHVYLKTWQVLIPRARGWHLGWPGLGRYGLAKDLIVVRCSWIMQVNPELHCTL